MPRSVDVSAALARGTQFLAAAQGRDGLWRDFDTPAGEATEWPTGFIASALRLAGAEAGVLDRAAEALLASQHDDGGWAYNESVPSDADSTACALLFLALSGHRGSACEQAASFLRRHQRENGGVATYAEASPIRRFMGVGRWMRFRGWCGPHTEVTAMAGRALAALAPPSGGEEAAAAWRYVRSQQRGDGSWSSYWWTLPYYATLQAVELAILHADRDAVERAADWTLRTEADGSWSDSPFATALSLSILVHAGSAAQPLEPAIAALVALQMQDGGWPSRPIMRIPWPGDADPNRERRRPRRRRGIVVADHHRTFTAAACVAALAGAERAGFG